MNIGRYISPHVKLNAILSNQYYVENKKNVVICFS